jgi:hypothetical protein
MKNKLISSLFISLLTVAMVSCGSSGGSGDNTPVTPIPTPTPEPTPTWSEVEALVMSTHLHDYVFPRYKDETTVTFNEEESKVILNGGDVQNNELSTYALKLSDDFEVKDISRINNLQEGSIYKGFGEFDTSLGVRCVEFLLYAENNTGVPSSIGEGTFYLEAYDPYVYSFPSEFISYYAELSFYSKEVPPALEAKYYEIDDSELAIYCYLDSNLDDGGYSEILTNAHWNVLEEKYDDTFYVAVSPDEQYALYYLYDSGIKTLDIHLAPIPYWPINQINDFYTKYDLENFGVVPIEGSFYLYRNNVNNDYYYEHEMYELITAFVEVYNVSRTTFDAYLTNLESSGYKVTENSNKDYTIRKLIPDVCYGKYDIEYYENESSVKFTLYYAFDPIPESEWPSEEIAHILGEGFTDSVPEYEGANNGFAVIEDYMGYMVLVSVKAGTETSGVASYKETLLNAGYTEYGLDYYSDTIYMSPNHEIAITTYYATSGSVTITFADARFPEQNIKSILEYNGITDSIPAFIESYGTDVYLYQGDLEICLLMPKDANTSQAIATYISILLNNGFTLNGESPKYSIGQCLSPNGQFNIVIYELSGNLYIDLTTTNGADFVIPSEEVIWPSEDISEAIKEIGEFTFPTPSFAFNSVEIEDFGEKVWIDIYLAGSMDPSNCASLYCASLLSCKDGMKSKTDGNATIITDGVIDIRVTPVESFGNKIVSMEVTIHKDDPSEETTFPSETISSLFPNLEYPVITDSDVIYSILQVVDLNDWKEIDFTATFTSVALAESAFEDYKMSLIKMGYTYSSYYQEYYSSDETTTVYLSLNENIITFYFYITMVY